MTLNSAAQGPRWCCKYACIRVAVVGMGRGSRLVCVYSVGGYLHCGACSLLMWHATRFRRHGQNLFTVCTLFIWLVASVNGRW